MVDIKKLLLNKWHQKKLGHFYLIAPHYFEPNKKFFIENWMKDFLATLISLKTQKSKEEALQGLLQFGHPDILIIEKDSKNQDKDYTIDEFSDFFKFLFLKTTELNHRFIVVTDIHLISENLSNKLLKSLEDTTINTTIFFLENKTKSYLSTISSRTIKIRLPLSVEPQEDKTEYHKMSFEKWLQKNITTSEIQEELESDFCLSPSFKQDLLSFLNKELPILDIIDGIKQQRGLEDKLLKLLLQYEAESFSSYPQKQKILNALKFYTRSKPFHDNPSTRIYHILEAL